jgi:fumarylacetoacetate (FAA) hydrolase family protein
MQGGGEGAAQCEALAQLSLGEADTAAAALERIAARSEAGLAARAAVFGQAAEAWSAESGPVGAISRDPADVVAQMIGAHHQYPDGAVLYLGTSFSPAKDRGAPGMGFTHHEGDVMRIASHRRLTSPRI